MHFHEGAGQESNLLVPMYSDLAVECVSSDSKTD